MPKLPRITAKQLVSALKKLGFVELRQRGSHLTLINQSRGALCTVPMHANETLAPKTLQSIIQQSGISVDDLTEAL